MAAYKTQVLGLLLNIDLDSILELLLLVALGAMSGLEGSEVVIHCPSLRQAHQIQSHS